MQINGINRKLLSAAKYYLKRCENCNSYDCKKSFCKKLQRETRAEEKCWRFHWSSEEVKEEKIRNLTLSFSKI